MDKLIKPEKLKKGDGVVIITSTRSEDDDMMYRLRIGKQRLQDILGLLVIEIPDTYSSACAEEFMWALKNPSVKAILSNIGGDDYYCTLPLIDRKVIHDNPKILMGYSDITPWTTCFTTSGVMSYYGPNVIAQLSNPNGIPDDTIKSIQNVLFSSDVIGEGKGYHVLCGNGNVRGRLFAGCGQLLWQMIDKDCFPDKNFFEGIIFVLELGFFHKSSLAEFCMLRALKAAGVFKKAVGIITGFLDREGMELLIRFMKDEVGREDMPILMAGDFRHPTPLTYHPIGAMAEICCDRQTVTLLESGVL